MKIKELFGMRLRYLVLIGGSLLALLGLWVSDPDNGAMTSTMLLDTASAVIAVLFAYFARKGLHDYVKMQELYTKAKETAVGAAIVFLGMCIVTYGMLGLFGNRAHAGEVDANNIPKQAYVHLPRVELEMDTYWVDHPNLQPYQP